MSTRITFTMLCRINYTKLRFFICKYSFGNRGYLEAYVFDENTQLEKDNASDKRFELKLKILLVKSILKALNVCNR